jgi:hypothetical protein
VSIEILVEPYYLARISLDLAIALGCVFMFIGPCFKMCWLRKYPDKSAEESKKGFCEIFCSIGGALAIGAWLFHILDMGSDIYYIANADIRKPSIYAGCLVCVLLPLLACYCCCVKDAGPETVCMLICNCFILKDKFAREDKQ